MILRIDEIMLAVTERANDSGRFHAVGHLNICEPRRDRNAGDVWLLPVDWSSGKKATIALGEMELELLGNDALVDLMYDRLCALVFGSVTA